MLHMPHGWTPSHQTQPQTQPPVLGYLYQI